MARYKAYSYTQGQLIPVDFSRQIQSGSFEYALNHIIDHEIDLSVFAARFKNDATGATAYDPAILLKIILFAYSRGITSSRQIERACCENVTFMALAANSRPHFTTIADFISSMEKEVSSLFRDVLLMCDELGLIGKEMFAIDGCKLPSNASKEWSGTKADFKRKAEKMEKTVQEIMRKHKTFDAHESAGAMVEKDKEEKHIKNLKAKVNKIKQWLAKNDDKPGMSNKPKKSNITDNESAKMATSHGVIQGYNGVAVVDQDNQVIVAVAAVGDGNERPYLKRMIEAADENLKSTEEEDDLQQVKIIADSGYHSEENVKYLEESQRDGYLADNRMRQRDVKLLGYERHKQPVDRHKTPFKRYFTPSDFKEDPKTKTLVCPAGQRLRVVNEKLTIKGKGYQVAAYVGRKETCGQCPLRKQCMRNPKSRYRQVHKRTRGKSQAQTATQRMQAKIDSPQGRSVYSQRMGIIEPVFGHIRQTMGLNRFRRRGQKKVNIEWNLYAIVHNLKKIHHYGGMCI